MAKIILDITKNAMQNAQAHFESAKKARKKLEGAKIALQKAMERLDSLRAEHEKKQEKKQTQVVQQKRKPEWYEKFRWFVSSEGFLVIGGRDATTNEIIIKKHTGAEDIVFHTDMAGSPFFVIKTDGKKPGDTTLQETANATFSFSRALKLGLFTTRTFWVKPDQITKEARAGEYVSKGAFVIRGKTMYIAPAFDLAIGITEDGAVMCGPVNAIQANTRKHVLLDVKKAKTSDVAKRIRNMIGGGLDEVIRALPPGDVDIKNTQERRNKR